MTKNKQAQIIREALGEASVLFMSQKVKGTEIVMPTEELERISKRAVEELNKK